jgi:hypothetical protein
MPRSDSTVPAIVPAGNAYTTAPRPFRKNRRGRWIMIEGDNDPHHPIAAAGTEFRIQPCVS